MLRFDEVVLFFVGMVGVILGAVSLVARADAVGIVLGVIVFGMGMASLWFGWQTHRDSYRRHARSVRPS